MTWHDRKKTALAWLGLELARPTAPQGAPPTDEELALFIEGRLAPRRRRELVTHLLADEVLYQRLDMLAGIAAPDTRPAPSENWLTRLREGCYALLTHHRLAMTGLALAGLALVIMLPLWTPTGPTPGHTGQTQPPLAESAGTEASDWKRQAILRGYREDPTLTAPDPATPEAALRALGHWMQRAERVCPQASATQRKGLLDTLANIRRRLPSSIRSAILSEPPTDPCAQLGRLKKSLGFEMK